VTTIQIHRADGHTTIISGGEDGTLRLWNPETGREIEVPAVLPWPIDALARTGADQIVAASGSEAVALAIRN
ncbi:hypothetical protein AB0G74_29875, partial [Streptomyces sp. NPDC020875]